MKHHRLEHASAVEHQARSTEIRAGIQRFIHRWTPVQSHPWASLTIVHGLGDHGGRFDNMAVSIASSGIGVVAVDLMGHGRSPGKRGIIPSYDSLLDEVGNAVAFAQQTWKNVPSFAFGQSMGGNLVLNWTMRRPFESHSIHGVIAVAPMLRLAKSPRPQFLRAGRWLEKRWPDLRIKAPVDVRQLCHDPMGQDAYLRDPYVHRRVSLRLGNALIDSGEWALDHAEQLGKPCLLMHGSDDTLTSPIATEEMAKRLGERGSLKLWPNCRHDLHFEMQRESVTTHLVGWMKEHTHSTHSVRSSKPLKAA